VAARPAQYVPGASADGARAVLALPAGAEEVLIEACGDLGDGRQVLLGGASVAVAALAGAADGVSTHDLVFECSSSAPPCGPLRAVVRAWLPGAAGLGAAGLAAMLAARWEAQLQRWVRAHLAVVAERERAELAEAERDSAQEAGALQVTWFEGGAARRARVGARIAEVKAAAEEEGAMRQRRAEQAAEMIERVRSAGDDADARQRLARKHEAERYREEGQRDALASGGRGYSRAAALADAESQHLVLLRWQRAERCAEIRAARREDRIQVAASRSPSPRTNRTRRVQPLPHTCAPSARRPLARAVRPRPLRPGRAGPGRGLTPRGGADPSGGADAARSGAEEGARERARGPGAARAPRGEKTRTPGGRQGIRHTVGRAVGGKVGEGEGATVIQ